MQNRPIPCKPDVEPQLTPGRRWQSKDEQEAGVRGYLVHKKSCRDTSLIRNRVPLGPYSWPMLKALRWSQVGGQFFMSEIPLYVHQYNYRRLVHAGTRHPSPLNARVHLLYMFFSPIDSIVVCLFARSINFRAAAALPQLDPPMTLSIGLR